VGGRKRAWFLLIGRQFADTYRMRVLLFSVIIGLTLGLSAADGQRPRRARAKTPSFVNLHANDRNLLGIWVQQFPDCREEGGRYVGKHPAMIVYMFRGGRSHQINSEPDGRCTGDFWSKTTEAWVREKAGYWFGNPRRPGVSHERPLPPWYQTRSVIRFPIHAPPSHGH
jgi:hypothetical protein